MSLADPTRPVLGFLGPHLGGRAGWVTTQSEVLVGLFRQAGFTVRAASHFRSPLLRALHMASALWRWRPGSARTVDGVSISVFSGRAFAIAELTSRIARGLGLPQVLVLHGGDLPRLAEGEPERVRRLLARADAIVAPSPFLARTAEGLGFEVEVIPNVLELGAYDYRHRSELGRPLRLLWMRTFHEIYRPGLALELLAELVKRGLDARLTLAGQDKGLLGACRRRAQELAVTERVSFPGFLDAEAKRRAFDEHDVFLSTNSVDNTPVSVLEAAASGLPVVAVAAGGLVDLLGPGSQHGERGLLVDELGEHEREGDLVRRLADAVERLHAEPMTVARLSAAGRELAEASAWPRVAERWLHLFERLGAERHL